MPLSRIPPWAGARPHDRPAPSAGHVEYGNASSAPTSAAGDSGSPVDLLEEAIDKRAAAGESEQAATLAIIEDFERSAATVNARTTPLVPASGIIVTGAGILAKDGGSETIPAFLAMLFAFIGLAFLATALFTHAGRPSVGIEPTRADIPFVHERLTRKESQAQKGSFFSFVGFVTLVIVIV